MRKKYASDSDQMYMSKLTLMHRYWEYRIRDALSKA